MADEAYRAVFLRVHPTGKMVLSLTTEADGEEARYAQLVAAELGVPALDVKVVPADALRWDNGAFVGEGGAQTIADVALYAHGTGELPPGVEGGLDAQTVYTDA